MQDDIETDDEPLLTEAQADEVLDLVQAAFSGRVTMEAPVDGDVEMVVGQALGHTVSDYTLWLTDAMIGLSLCPACGAVSLYFLTQDHRLLHGAIEVVEELRTLEGLGGDIEELVCTYRRTTVLEDGDREAHVYTFGATYWLDCDDIGDRVMHTTRALVVILDAVITTLSTAAERAEEILKKRMQDGRN